MLGLWFPQNWQARLGRCAEHTFPHSRPSLPGKPERSPGDWELSSTAHLSYWKRIHLPVPRYLRGHLNMTMFLFCLECLLFSKHSHGLTPCANTCSCGKPSAANQSAASSLHAGLVTRSSSVVASMLFVFKTKNATVQIGFFLI